METTETEAYWDGIAEVRRKLQQSPTTQQVFIDQSQIKLNWGPTHGLSLAGTPAPVKGKTARHWEQRVDFMGAVCGGGQLAIEVKTPAERKESGVKGWRKVAVLDFIRRPLASAIRTRGLERVVLVADKALRIKPEELRDALVEGGVVRAQLGIVLPTSTAKYVSPLDNNLWHEMKAAIRRHDVTDVEALVPVIRAEWNNVSIDHIRNYYKHCALVRGADLYYGRT